MSQNGNKKHVDWEDFFGIVFKLQRELRKNNEMYFSKAFRKQTPIHKTI